MTYPDPVVQLLPVEVRADEEHPARSGILPGFNLQDADDVAQPEELIAKAPDRSETREEQECHARECHDSLPDQSRPGSSGT